MFIHFSYNSIQSLKLNSFAIRSLVSFFSFPFQTKSLWLYKHIYYFQATKYPWLKSQNNLFVSKLFLKLFVSLDMEFLVLDNDYLKDNLQKFARILQAIFFLILSYPSIFKNKNIMFKCRGNSNKWFTGQAALKLRNKDT